jgi:ATP-dependent exoDNAse (exonuclease V) beta subunit
VIQPGTHPLTDSTHRVVAMSAHQRTLLIEAGAGSGKTAIIAGRIALLLASGEPARNIAAVTFTELAASELLARVRDYVDRLLAHQIPAELEMALPNGLSPDQRSNLDIAAAQIDEITCSTIHGFCQRLIKPYPAEANIDPGANVADRGEADLIFSDLRDVWLRDRLAAGGSQLLAELVAIDPKETVDTVTRLSDAMRNSRSVATRPLLPLSPLHSAFVISIGSFEAFLTAAPCQEVETAAIFEAFQELRSDIDTQQPAEHPATLARLVNTTGNETLFTKDGAFRKFQKKGKWEAARKTVGLSKAQGDALFSKADANYTACCDAWNALTAQATDHLLAGLVAELDTLLLRYAQHKREAALLDFDDLIFSARNLLRDRDEVRRALAGRYTRILVDEFQDTDPLQTEILWRLCGEAPATNPDTHWSQRILRPGALFLVGDPKQAIYRFRGADVATYLEARTAIQLSNPDNVISIVTNFRSCRSILDFVNDRFAAPLSQDGQPGFTPLNHWHDDPKSIPCVAAIDVTVPDDANANLMRDCEAEAVADLCARLIGSHSIYDHKLKQSRICRPGDIALLAPTGSDLWRYEEALEAKGIPVATQAGKGFFWRQEIQDLIALTRVLADRRDTIALGALLRGPLVGLTEEELLDIAWALPRLEESDVMPHISLGVDVQHVTHARAHDVLTRLQTLARMANSTTPHHLLSQTVGELCIRAHLLYRHHGQAERALANVDLYLNLSRSYAIRGLRAFAEAMTSAWEDESKAGEGRPDAQEESVSLYTMHAAKGLEWPIVVPVNTSTSLKDSVGAVLDRNTGHLYCKLFGNSPTGYDDIADGERTEFGHERVRLWYVAATRARETLVIPRLSKPAARRTWIELANLSLERLPSLDLSSLSTDLPSQSHEHINTQDRAVFVQQAGVIAKASPRLNWIAPSRSEEPSAILSIAEQPVVHSPGITAQDGGPPEATERIRGGRERGLVMHKLFEEILTGEISEKIDALEARAGELLQELGYAPTTSAEIGFSPGEIARSVLAALKLPEIAAIRPTLVPECHVYSSTADSETETITFGIADAIAFATPQSPSLVVDWKSDVHVDEKLIADYRKQVASYLAATGIPEGLIVFVTTSRIERVRHLAPSP